MRSSTAPVLILHGGAGGRMPEERKQKIREALRTILEDSYKKLLRSNALEAAVHAVRLLEDNPLFNAGTGSMLQSDGKARLSASLMDGASLRFSGVINVQNLPNPVLLARLLQKEKDRVLAGPEAFLFAVRKGLKTGDPRTKEAVLRWKKQRERKSDTVGACALDERGKLAAATSTGGKGFETPGRVSDSGMPVSTYADARCAVSATGIGEEIMDQGLAVKIAARLADGMELEEAFGKTFAEVRKSGHRMGAIGLDRRGNVSHATTTEVLIYGWKKRGGEKIF